MISAFPDNQVQGKITGCDYGSYYAYAGSAGNLSDFRATFKYSSSGISDLNISTTGVRIGWEIADQSTYYIADPNGAFSGCTTIIANFSLGIISWDVYTHINSNFNPLNCMYTYSQGEGPCEYYIAP